MKSLNLIALVLALSCSLALSAKKRHHRRYNIGYNIGFVQPGLYYSAPVVVPQPIWYQPTVYVYRPMPVAYGPMINPYAGVNFQFSF